MAVNPSKRSFESFSGPDSIVLSQLPSSKKTRPNAAPDPALWDMITKLPPLTAQTILWQICSENPTSAEHVITAHKSRLTEEANRPPATFDHHSKACWYTLNKEFKRLSSHAQWDMIGRVDHTLGENLTAVMEQAGPATRWETRRNALEVLRKISKSIMLCGEHLIRRELMKDGLTLGGFAESMLKLAKGMMKEERDRYKEEGLYEKLVDLQNECDWQTDMEGLQEIYELFDGDLDDDNDEDNEDEAPSDTADFEEIQPPPMSPIPQRKRVFSVIELD